MKPYEHTQESCAYGQYDSDNKAGYILTHPNKLRTPWYYIYNNGKILLYVDQNGPVKIQHMPPNGILPIKREMGENQSKWQVWVESKDLNSGIPVSNFGSPNLRYDLPKPEATVNWLPEKAVYTLRYDTADIVTELFVPKDKATVCMKTTVINKNDRKMYFNVTPALFPYANIPQMDPWDLPEWYLSVKAIENGGMLTLAAQVNDPHMVKENNRSVTFNMDYERGAKLELDMTKFCGSGNFFSPDTVKYCGNMSYDFEELSEAGFSTKQSVFAARYSFSLLPGRSRTFTQVITVQEDTKYNERENMADRIYFDSENYQNSVSKVKEFYERLFTRRTIKTSNTLYDNFINNFVPLQMSWVCSLDRGWPSGMRGVRDASQDFMGMIQLDSSWTRRTIIELFTHQRTDGWMPRQISTVSRTAPHDMRYYCDGGAFLLELCHEYLTYTRDWALLDEETVWLDSEEKSTILCHMERCTDFYLDAENIGEHGLCKVWYGDWWDPMDKIGMDGRGESVTVTAQMILNLTNLSEMYTQMYSLGMHDRDYNLIVQRLLKYKEAFGSAMRTHAYNSEGYFNGYFNDNGKWLLSDSDPDGEKRVYLVSNAWALISGCADKEMQRSVLNTIENECFGKLGYNTRSKGYAVYVDKAGRVGNGTSPGASPYNHAQSFLVRACCECGDAEMAYKATRYILPIEEKYAPVTKTCAPPYAIVNMYNSNKRFMHRAGFQFLSGTVSYVLRTVYSFFLGIKYCYDGLMLKPCIPESFGNVTVEFDYLDKHFVLRYTPSKEKGFSHNGRTMETQLSEKSGIISAFLPDCRMTEHNEIEIKY